jgi:hypothetical protein
MPPVHVFVFLSPHPSVEAPHLDLHHCTLCCRSIMTDDDRQHHPTVRHRVWPARPVRGCHTQEGRSNMQQLTIFYGGMVVVVDGYTLG